jgi:putative membrane protein
LPDNPNRARDHLANERTFLAWVRTGVATIVFGFAIGRFSIALREFMKFQGYSSVTPGLTTWLGIISTVGGVLLIFAGLRRYRETKGNSIRTPSSPRASSSTLCLTCSAFSDWCWRDISHTSKFSTNE